jgi:hypothetical protein
MSVVALSALAGPTVAFDDVFRAGRTLEARSTFANEAVLEGDAGRSVLAGAGSTVVLQVAVDTCTKKQIDSDVNWATRQSREALSL